MFTCQGLFSSITHYPIILQHYDRMLEAVSISTPIRECKCDMRLSAGGSHKASESVTVVDIYISGQKFSFSFDILTWCVCNLHPFFCVGGIKSTDFKRQLGGTITNIIYMGIINICKKTKYTCFQNDSTAERKHLHALVWDDMRLSLT